MLLIVMHHFSVHGAGYALIYDLTFNSIWTQVLALWGKLGVNLFVLITGFFCVKSTVPRLSSLIFLWFTTLTYSVVC